ncbi:MAG: diadenylate cyclase [Puniceicoccales bacterium]|jgi:DNA integrity scanning protein DisA with diadenylate cyclase activity/mannitol/fructose-specific phosphotransferase system IIA component (Ntr-type)|nr:diadenylate cyclase [Puniceicoccales bacterium]
MAIDGYFAHNRLINLDSDTLEGALGELLASFPRSLNLDRGALLHHLLLREKSIPTYLGNGIAIPHLRIPLRRPCMLAVGRCPNGLRAEGQPEYGDARLLFLILFDESYGGYLQILSNLARIFHDPQRAALLTRNQPLHKLYAVLHDQFRAPEAPNDATSAPGQDQRALRLFLRESYHLSQRVGCSSVLIFADAVVGWFAFGHNFHGMKRILVTERQPDEMHTNCQVDHVLTVSNYSPHRLVQAHSAILLALSRNLLQVDEKVCCIGGPRGGNRFDCLLIVNVAEEYRALLNARRGLIPKDVRPEVFERLVAIAHEIAMEGREGRPIGAMFVIGNHERIKDHYRALVLNPFHGYPRQERNILNPFMAETIKEFALLDGAFIVDGDGVLEAAGAMIHATEQDVALPGGLGTRHASAATFSRAHDCLIAVISQSNGQVSLFRNGQMLSLAGKVLG